HRHVEQRHEGTEDRAGDGYPGLRIRTLLGRHFVLTSASTERPGRSDAWMAASAAILIRTGTRWTILVKLPVAFSGGSRANSEPVPGARLSTVPSTLAPGRASTVISTGWPGRIRPTWVSLKLATR